MDGRGAHAIARRSTGGPGEGTNGQWVGDRRGGGGGVTAPQTPWGHASQGPRAFAALPAGPDRTTPSPNTPPAIRT